MISLVRSVGGMLSKRYSEQPIDNLDQWMEIGAGAGVSGAGMLVDSKSPFRLPAAYACIALKARVASVLPCKVYQRINDGLRDRRRADDHYLYPILNRQANPTLPSNEWRALVSANLDGWGNHYSWIEWDKRPVPKAFWPLPPDRVKVERKSATSPIQYFIQSAGRWEEFPAEDILHVRGLGDGTIGWSPVQLMRETFGIGLAQEQSAASLHSNGMTSRMVLETDTVATPEQMKMLKDSYQAANAGAQNRHKAIVLQAGFKAKAISINPKDAQFLEMSQFTDSKIYQVFGTPPHMVGDTEKATSWGTGIEQQTIGYINYRVTPDMNLIENAIEQKILPTGSPFFIEHDFRALLRGDTKARGEWHKIMIDIGSESPNDVLRAENEEPYEGGDVFRRPLNTAFVDKTGKVVSFTPPGQSNGAPNDTQTPNA